jgi:hypothetical protein
MLNDQQRMAARDEMMERRQELLNIRKMNQSWFVEDEQSPFPLAHSFPRN